MSGHTVVGFERWTLRPDQAEGAERVTSAIQCALCGRTSPRSENVARLDRWAANHAARNTLHDAFRAITHTPYRAARIEGGEA